MYTVHIFLVLSRDKSMLQPPYRHKEKCGINFKNPGIGENAQLHDGR